MMWAEILLENRQEIIPPLKESAGILMRLAELLEENKEDALRAVLEEGQLRRQSLEDNNS
jgi:prephenate dehydrogenase